MNTWLETFIEQSDLNRYPIALRTEGGIGFQTPDGIVSNFVGHPVHYEENRQMKPITLDWIPSTGEFEGSWFGWDTIKKCPTYCGYELYTPKAIVWNGIAYPLNFLRLENRMIADIPIGMYEIVYNEWGMNEIITIPFPVEGTLEFDAPEQPGWDGYLYKSPRRIIGGEQSGNIFTLTKNMTYPLVIDPDYSADSSDGYVQGDSATYSTARSTSTYFSAGVDYLGIFNYLDGIYYVLRAFLKFDTSGIPDGDSVSQVVMKCTVRSVGATAFDVQIVKNDWSGYDPLSSGNRESAFDSVLTSSLDDNIWKNTSGLSANTPYSSGNLSTSWINKTGYTYYSMQSKNDRDNVTPLTNGQYIQIYSQDSATSGYRPVLTVTHAAGSSRKRLSLLGIG